jgi:hypothetical protein
MCFLKELIVCVAYLRQQSRVNFRSTKVDAGKLKRKYLNRPWSTLAVKVLKLNVVVDLLASLLQILRGWGSILSPEASYYV